MNEEMLEPRLDLVSDQRVLVQAWKKTASYIRSHNWYADTLDLDVAAVNLPDFLHQLAEQLQSPNQWENDRLRIVPAPKSQRWEVIPGSGRWQPVNKAETAKKLRPLAHVTLKDQVAATSLMMCLADRVETLQGDPRTSIHKPRDRKLVVSYGNRLFCDDINGRLRHRWGSVKLYRAYFQDYRKFLSRPELIAEEVAQKTRVVFLHSDLRQFYDRVRPAVLAEKIDSLRQPGDDSMFFEMFQRILCWEWHKKDEHEVTEYAKRCELGEFSTVALPQGLVASGFFANVVLLEFDEALRGEIDKEFIPGAVLKDVCRYVDDIRLVLSVEKELGLEEIEAGVVVRLQELLTRTADGLVLSEDKTQAALYRGDQRPLVGQSRKMRRIQQAISGGFDAIGGMEILDTVQGLVSSQARYSKERTKDQGWALAPIPDVRDETVLRFAAARFRSTFRSLRPLLEDRAQLDENVEAFSRVTRTRKEIDDEARAFALTLIENWVEDPSNVRLLRVGLDLWPSPDVLKRVLEILCQYTTKGGRHKAPWRVAWYCLAEVFRAGATETGFVEDDELLPDGIDIDGYREALLVEAERLAVLPAGTLPWYLKQQVLLFLASNNPERAPIVRSGRNPETRKYRELVRFLRGDVKGLGDRDFATLAVLARRSFLDTGRALNIVNAGITQNRAKLISERDPSFALEILATNQDIALSLPGRIRQDLCLGPKYQRKGWVSLAQLVLSRSGELRTELTLLEFVAKYLERFPLEEAYEVITPSDVVLRLEKLSTGRTTVTEIDFMHSKLSPSGSLYRPPDWCPPMDRWRLQLGYLLRFILSAQPDFTRVVRQPHWKEGTVTYRAPESHWYHRFHGFFSGHSAFGADWLPITDWTEELLYALLSWPGCRASEFHACFESGIDETRIRIEKRIRELSDMQGQMSNTPILRLSPRWPERPRASRPLRICVVQSVIPQPADFRNGDLSLSGAIVRRRHRNHLSSALAAVERLLDLRETHKGSNKRLDFLILPELSVHPHDVETHLVPFARAHRSIILAGLTYEEVFLGEPLVNSALWVIPAWSEERGLQIITRRQGKYHLSPEEQQRNNPIPRLQGFRPCQWLVGYEWDFTGANRPLWLTASVCYDATDIRLTADLRDQSDIFAVPAMNQDVNTFDQMALALHYHMFQMVIVANNGTFGGSNAYSPYREAYKRQVFHVHGQPQATIAFLEIEDIGEFLRRGVQTNPDLPGPDSPARWKYPPAGVVR